MPKLLYVPLHRREQREHRQVLPAAAAARNRRYVTDLFRLEARGIRKSFGGVEVLHGVDLDATGGTVLALLGENGAGKSTLVKILAGDYEPDAGAIEIAGDRVTARSTRSPRGGKGIRMIFQELAAAPDLTVAENMLLGRWPVRRGFVGWRAAAAAARRILEQLGVDLDLGRPGSTLRIGERQIDRDRPRAARRGALPHPRRADRRALAPGGRAAVRVRPAPARQRRRDHLHHPPARRGARDRRPRAGPARRLVGARRARRRASSATTSSRRWSARDDRRRRAARHRSWARRRPPSCSAFASPQVAAGVRDVDLDGRRRRGRRALRQDRLGHRRRSAEAAFGVRQLDGGPARARRHRGPSCDGPAHAIRAGVGFLPGRPPARRRVHGPAGGGEPVRAVVAAPRARSAVSDQPRVEANGVPALARRAQHPLAQRPEQPIGDALGRQPAEGAARPLARARLAACSCWSSRRAASTSAPARRSTGRSGSSPPTASACSSSPPTTRRSCRSRTARVVMARGAVGAQLAGDEITVERLSAAAGE